MPDAALLQHGCELEFGHALVVWPHGFEQPALSGGCREWRRRLGFAHGVGPVLAYEAEWEFGCDVAELDVRGARVGLAVLAARVARRESFAQGVARLVEPRGVQSRQRSCFPESSLCEELELLGAGRAGAAGLRVAVEMHLERVGGA